MRMTAGGNNDCSICSRKRANMAAEVQLNGNYFEDKFFVEGTLRWKNYVLYSSVIAIGDASVTVEADAEFIYEASDRYAALTSESPENSMIGLVTASFVPIAAN